MAGDPAGGTMTAKDNATLAALAAVGRKLTDPVLIIVAAALVLWGREFGTIAAMALFAASVAFAGFCIIAYIKSDWRGDAKPKGRAVWKYGQFLTWGVLAPAWALAVGAFVAGKMWG